jgi:hypothetical protein
MFKKIDLYFKSSDGKLSYISSTKMTKTCKEAKRKYISRLYDKTSKFTSMETEILKDNSRLVAYFDKEK